MYKYVYIIHNIYLCMYINVIRYHDIMTLQKLIRIHFGFLRTSPFSIVCCYLENFRL